VNVKILAVLLASSQHIPTIDKRKADDVTLKRKEAMAPTRAPMHDSAHPPEKQGRSKGSVAP